MPTSRVYPFHRPPIHLQGKIEAKLERSVQQGIMEPVDVAVCPFPMVSVLKPTAEIRICGDFKPLNKFLTIDK
jgi:hypothetical protein